MKKISINYELKKREQFNFVQSYYNYFFFIFFMEKTGVLKEEG